METSHLEAAAEADSAAAQERCTMQRAQTAVSRPRSHLSQQKAGQYTAATATASARECSKAAFLFSELIFLYFY